MQACVSQQTVACGDNVSVHTQTHARARAYTQSHVFISTDGQSLGPLATPNCNDGVTIICSTAGREWYNGKAPLDTTLGEVVAKAKEVFPEFRLVLDKRCDKVEHVYHMQTYHVYHILYIYGLWTPWFIMSWSLRPGSVGAFQSTRTTTQDPQLSTGPHL